MYTQPCGSRRSRKRRHSSYAKMRTLNGSAGNHQEKLQAGALTCALCRHPNAPQAVHVQAAVEARAVAEEDGEARLEREAEVERPVAAERSIGIG